MLGITLHAAENFWDEIPLSPSTTRPSEVLDDYWNSEFQRVNREVAAAKKAELVFFGDSITWSWSLGPATGRTLWEDQFRDYNPINMGNSGDITPVMLHRVTRGNLDFPAWNQPKVAVLLCGINNFIVAQSAGGKEKWDLGADCPPEEIAQGQRAIAQVFRRKLPQTRVIMMALLPLADAAKWAKCQRINTIQAGFSRHDSEVTFVNLQDSFLLPGGAINRSLFTDGIHLSKEGYVTWAKGIAPVIEKFMKAPPLTPIKIMLIGDAAVEGIDSSTSYRRYLDGILRRNGHMIDFVGSRKKHHNDQTEPDSYQFDPDHEGHWDKDSTWIAENMPRLLEGNVPDIAVIHSGTGEVVENTGDADALTDGIIRNITRVIDALRSKNPMVKVFIAPPVPAKGKEQASVLLKQKITQLANSSQHGQQPVVVADIGRGFDSNRDLDESGTFPNADGARKIAETLSEAIHSEIAAAP